MQLPSASWTLPLPRSTRRLELDGLVRILRLDLPPRVVVAGGPRAGKSHLAQALASLHRIRHGEELVGLDWSAGSLIASLWLNEPGPWICENVAMARALRKWLARNPDGVPADLIVHLGEMVSPRSRGQHAMAAGCITVWKEIRPELEKRGARIVEI